MLKAEKQPFAVKIQQVLLGRLMGPDLVVAFVVPLLDESAAGPLDGPAWVTDYFASRFAWVFTVNIMVCSVVEKAVVMTHGTVVLVLCGTATVGSVYAVSLLIGAYSFSLVAACGVLGLILAVDAFLRAPTKTAKDPKSKFAN